MEFSSYDQLLRQVDILKVENNNLRKELADNSNHLSQLENEASTMKEVLIHRLSNGRMDAECEGTTITTTMEVVPDNRQARRLSSNDGDNCDGVGNDDLSNSHNPGSFQAQVQQLERERARILQDIEGEEKDKQLFHAAIENINKQLYQLSNTNMTDNSRRRQLEREADSLRETMQQKLGSMGEMHRREEARVHSICLIDKEIEKLYHLQENSNKYVNSEKMDVESLNEKSMTDLDEDMSLLMDHSKMSETDDLKLSTKMTTSCTQTLNAFSSISTAAGATKSQIVVSPTRPPEGDSTSLASIYHGSWPLDKVLWHSGPSSVSTPDSTHSFHNHDTGSIASGKYNTHSGNGFFTRSNDHQLGTKVEMVYSLLSMLGSHNKDDVSRKLLSMSSSVDSCIAMRQSGCMPLLVELLHGDDKEASAGGGIYNRGRKRPSKETRQRASEALHNVVHSHPDDKRGRREARVLRLLEQIRDYCSLLSDTESESNTGSSSSDDDNALCSFEYGDNHGNKVKAEGAEKNIDKHPVPAMAMLMKLSFDEEHRHAMCQLGGLQATAELLQNDYETHGNLNDQQCITLRRYAGMALTNLTFGDGTNKALLCSLRPFMKALVAQLHSPSEDLRQVIASVLRNLSWRADQASKKTLREVGAVATLMKAAMEAKKESTLKSILSALWNLSAHCGMNKADICAVDGALAFLVGTLTYRSPSNTHSIVENGGGILRNISSHVAVREDYRDTLRQHNCLQILLLHLRSPSLTIVSNACGTLWNLSARCSEDQQALWDMGAVGMLKNLVHSKHKMISMGSSASLKNLLAAKPGGLAASADRNWKTNAPSLLVRKQKALEAELDQNLAETCENLDSPKTSPTHHRTEALLPKFGGTSSLRHVNSHDHNRLVTTTSLASVYQIHGRMYHSVGAQLPRKDNVSRSESRDSVLSTQSDSSHDRQRNLDILLRHRQKPAACHDIVNGSPRVPQGVLDSRIQYVMQEVTRQIALESEIIKNDCVSSSSSSAASYLKPNSMTKVAAKSVLIKPMAESTPRRTTFIKNEEPSKSLDIETNLTSMIENMNLEEEGDQTVDYSLKYSEGPNSCNVSLPQKKMSKSRKESVVFGDYAETDLDGPDQPTNFSLRYTEDTDTTDTFRAPDPQEGSPYFGHEYGAKGPSFHDDTIMTYCTEDTPLNFSTATSLSDLREFKDTPASIEEERIKKELSEDGHPISMEPIMVVGSDQVDSNVEVIQGLGDTQTESKLDALQKSIDATDCVSDRVVNYCVEGTPSSYSRMSPLSSIVSNDVSEVLENNVGASADEDISFDIENRAVVEKPYVADNSSNDATKTETDLDVRCNQPHEGKTVTFSEDQHYAEETPLMFSRCSSLGSLSSFDQHSIHDDRSSVISDFSRRASEVVSPSDLPDSPGQTLPPSPGARQAPAPVSFFGRASRDVPFNSRIAKPCPTRRSTIPVNVNETNTKKSVFEDSSKVYLDEGTPFGFSSTNSIASESSNGDLISNDHLLNGHDNSEHSIHKQQSLELFKPNDDDDKEISQLSLEVERIEINEASTEKSPAVLTDLSEDEEGDDNEDDILAACINAAMPNNSRDNRQKLNNTKLCSKINILSGTGATRMRSSSSIPVKSSNLKVGSNLSMANKIPQIATALSLNNTPNFKSNNVVCNVKDAPTIDCGSSDTSSVFDEDPERILAQCIRSGMPKSSNELSKHAGNLLVDRQGDGSPGPSDKENYDKIHFSHMYLRTRAAASSLATANCESVEDNMTVFAEEGTPLNFSNATSLSNLTVDSSNSEFPAENDGKQVFTSPNHCQSDVSRGKDGDFLATVKFPPMSQNNVFHDAIGAQRPNASSQCGNFSSPKFDEDAMIHYEQENTPSHLSHHSSLSALSVVTADVNGRDCGSRGSDCQRPFLVEDTPACFSQNSSLSSLSVESLLIEPSPSEQALLEECISSGMPKGQSSSTVTASNSSADTMHGGRLVRRSRLPCPALSSKDLKRKEVAKMDCIDEKPVTVFQSESGTKNVQGTAVVAESNTGASAGDMTGKETEGSNNTNSSSNHDAVLTSSCISTLNDRGQTKDPLDNHLEFGGALLVLLEATKISMDVQKTGREINIPESMEQSLVSMSSDLLDNVNPPSSMTEVSSSAVSTSGVSESNVHQDSAAVDSKGVGGNGPIARPRLTLVQRPKNVSELLMKALADSSGCKHALSTSVCESSENASLLLDNVKPPSVIEDVDLTSSMYSVCSIVSEVADSKSEGQLINDDDGSEDSVFKCLLKPAVAMAEMYARDVAKNSRRGYSVSEIENVNPPSTLLELNTLDDFTEVDVANTDTLENNDTDVEDDLPDDPEPWQAKGNLEQQHQNKAVSSEEDNELAVQQTHMHSFSKSKKTRNEMKNYEGSSKNGCEVGCQRMKECELQKEEQDNDEAENDEDEFDISPEEVMVLQENANLVLSTLKEMQFRECLDDTLFEDIECETLSLVSNESDSSYSTSEAYDRLHVLNPPKPVQQRGRPRIFKPGNNDYETELRPSDEHDLDDNGKNSLSATKSIRGRRKALYSRQKRPTASSSSLSATSATATATTLPIASIRGKDISLVKPTRTSALRATQSQQKVVSSVHGPVVNSKRIGSRCSTFVRSSSNNEVSTSKQVKQHSMIRPNNRMPENEDEDDDDNSESRPGPPIKQGTFTKEKPTLNYQPKISPTKTRIPAAFNAKTTSNREHALKWSTFVEDRPPSGGTVRTPSHARLVSSKSVDGDTVTSVPKSRVTCEKQKASESMSSPQPATRFRSRRGQSSSPVLRGLSNSTASPRSTVASSIGVHNSPSTHSLGSPGSNSDRHGCPQNSKVASLSTTKRSSSNGSLCSNASSSTSNSKFSGFSTRKEVQSKVSSLWKSVNKPSRTTAISAATTTTTKMETNIGTSSKARKTNLPMPSTPKEGISRSSTYEKIPTPDDLNVRADTVSEPLKEKLKLEDNSGAKTATGFLKKGTRALAETRLQEWLARKARVASKKSEEIADVQQTATSNGSVAVAAAIVTPFNYIPSSNQQEQQQQALPLASNVMPQRSHMRSLIPTPNQVSPFVRQQPREAYGHLANSSSSSSHDTNPTSAPIKRDCQATKQCLISIV